MLKLTVSGECSGTVKLSNCPGNMIAKVKLEDDEGKLHLATMFTNVITAINEGSVCTKLFQMVFTINNQDIVTRDEGAKQPGVEQAGASRCQCCCYRRRKT